MTDDDNDSHLAEAQIERERQRVYGPPSHRGSSGDGRDGRVSGFIKWGLTALGGAFVAGVWIAANNLWQINMTLAADAEYKRHIQEELNEQKALNARQDDHIDEVDGRVRTLEGRNLRGGLEVQRGK